MIGAFLFPTTPTISATEHYSHRVATRRTVFNIAILDCLPLETAIARVEQIASPMHKLDSLPSEVLTLVIEELVGYRYEYAAFGPTLQALSLVSRRFAKACEPYRFRDWEFVEEREEGRLEQHLSRPSFAANVQYLTVPVYDCRAVSRVRKGRKKDVTAYDTLLAQVIQSAVALKHITLVFDVSYDDDHPSPDENDRILLPKTLQTCIGKATSLRCLSVSDTTACAEASRVIREWNTLKRVEILAHTYPIGIGDEVAIVQDLVKAVMQRGELQELTYTLPMALHFQQLAPPIPKTHILMRGLTKLRVIEETRFRMDAWSLLVHQTIHINPNIVDLQISIYVLHLALTHGEEALDLSRLRVLRMDTESLAWFELNLGVILKYLCDKTGLLSSGSALSTLYLSGPKSVDLLQLILAKPATPSLRTISVRYPLKRQFTKTKLISLMNRCRDIGISLHLEGRGNGEGASDSIQIELP